MTFIDRQTALLKRLTGCKNIILFTTVMGIVKLIDRFSYENIQCGICIIEDICYETYKPSIKREDLHHDLAGIPESSSLRRILILLLVVMYAMVWWMQAL
jgi:hypothetical protein